MGSKVVGVSQSCVVFQGCYDKLIDYLKTYSAVVGCVAAVVPIFLVSEHRHGLL